MRIFWCAFIAFILQIELSAAQVLPGDQANTNVVKAHIKSETNDSIKCDLIQQLGKIQLLKPGNKKANLDSGLRYFLYSIKFSDSVHLRVNNKYEGMLRVGETYFRLNNFAAGKRYFMGVIDAYQKDGDKKREARTWLRFANMLKASSARAPEIIVNLKKAITLYHDVADHTKEAEALCSLGAQFHTQGQIDSAEHYSLAALKLYQASNSNDLGFTYHSLSLIYRNKGSLEKALKYILLAIDNANERGDTLKYENMAQRYGQLACVYGDLNDHLNALKNFRYAVYLSTKNTFGNSISNTAYFHITEVVRELLFLKRTSNALKEATGFFRSYPPVDSLQRGRQAEIWGLYFKAIKNYPEAEKWYLKMVAYYHCSATDEAWGNKLLAKFFIDQNKYAQARKYLDREFRNVNSESQSFMNNTEDEQFYYKIDSANGNFVSALDHFRRFKQKSDSAYNVNSARQLAEMRVRYETLNKEVAIGALQKDRTLLQKQIRQGNYIRNLIMGMVGLLLLFLIFLINSYRLKQKTARLIANRNTELNTLLNEKDELLEEKQWLLKEIHHRVKNNLQVVMGLMQRQSAFINNAEALEAMHDSENRIHSIALIHQKLYQSEHLDLIYMPDYIDEFITYLKDSFDLGNRIFFEKSLDEISLDVGQAVPLGLILNEAITNAVKYAYPNQQAGIIQIMLRKLTDDQYALIIQDFGRGLPDLFSLENVNSMGMNLMRGLSKQICGNFEIEQNQGVKITISFSVEKFFREIYC